MPGFRFGDADGPNTEEYIRAVKLETADGEYEEDPEGPLTDRIMRDGVQEPLRVVHRGQRSTLIDGHHRFFVQERRESAGEEVYLPLRHDEGWRP
jgi:hypothetical protein